MEFDNLIKLSGKEIVSFTKRNAESFAIVSDLVAARDNCDTKGARERIQTLIAPMMKDVHRECATFNTKMSSIWKKSKGEKIPADMQKKLDDLGKNAEKSFKSKTGQNIKNKGTKIDAIVIPSFGYSGIF